jgi:hypothetical protein
MYGCRECLSFPVMTKIVSTKTHHPKNKAMSSRGSIFCPLVAILVRTAHEVRSSICNPNPLLQTQVFQNLFVTPPPPPHPTSQKTLLTSVFFFFCFFCFRLVLPTDSWGIYFPAISGHFGTVRTWGPFLNLQPNPLLQTQEFQNPNNFFKGFFNSQKWGENFSTIFQIFYIWFLVYSQKYRRMITFVYFIFWFIAGFGYIFLGMITEYMFSASLV